MTIKTVKCIQVVINEGENNESVAYRRTKTSEDYEVEFWADWKEGPIDVVSMVNEALKQRGVNIKFDVLETGSDTYGFVIAKKAKS